MKMASNFQTDHQQFSDYVEKPHNQNVDFPTRDSSAMDTRGSDRNTKDTLGHGRSLMQETVNSNYHEVARQPSQRRDKSAPLRQGSQKLEAPPQQQYQIVLSPKISNAGKLKNVPVVVEPHPQSKPIQPYGTTSNETDNEMPATSLSNREHETIEDPYSKKDEIKNVLSPRSLSNAGGVKGQKPQQQQPYPFDHFQGNGGQADYQMMENTFAPSGRSLPMSWDRIKS